MITILGPTATGKTALAANLAYDLDGEVISADSRQVYKGMDLGTGKDYGDYFVGGKKIPVHLIDIVEPGYEYNVFEYQQDFLRAYADITSRGKTPILCGGTGLYLEAVLAGYNMKKIRKDPSFARSLEKKSDAELKDILAALRPLHNTTDLKDRKRMIKAIEVAAIQRGNETAYERFPDISSNIFGIRFDREILRKRITERLTYRLQNGMVGEVENLLKRGLTPEKLKFYGLEYRYITMYLLNELDYSNMFRLLNTAIHQFAKRQMTWYRRMEKKGFIIHWIDGTLDNGKKIETIKMISLY